MFEAICFDLELHDSELGHWIGPGSVRHAMILMQVRQGTRQILVEDLTIVVPEITEHVKLAAWQRFWNQVKYVPMNGYLWSLWIVLDTTNLMKSAGAIVNVAFRIGQNTFNVGLSCIVTLRLFAEAKFVESACRALMLSREVCPVASQSSRKEQRTPSDMRRNKACAS